MKLYFVLQVIAQVAMVVAKMGAGSASVFSFHQPNLPEQLMK